VADQLAQAKVPVLVDPLAYGPSSFDELYARPDNAALLAKAGVALILTTESTHNARTLRQVAGNAVREGLPHADALRAVTETPARVFGLPDRGRLAVGAAADVVLWSGDPLELSSRAERVWVDGVEVDLRSRQTELRERYRTLPGTPAPALPVK
jgi:imidazolonepropionase-like amidohydrolase